MKFVFAAKYDVKRDSGCLPESLFKIFIKYKEVIDKIILIMYYKFVSLFFDGY